MMLQGHTIDVFLQNESRTFDSFFYSTWYWFRGFTAPIFMFTSGAVFIYLLIDTQTNSVIKERINKGFLRGIQLIVIGYLLRYPSFAIFDFRFCTQQQWLIFFSVDALHLIGFGLLFSLIVVLTIKKNRFIIFIFFSLIVFLNSPFINKIEWTQFLTLPLAAYFNKDLGSIFPLFPYLGYIFAGAAFGIVLNNQPENYYKFIGYKTIGLAAIILTVSFYVLNYNLSHIEFLNTSFIQFQRIGAVLLFTSIMTLISLRIKRIPNFLSLIAKRSLLIYILHVAILYGSAWSTGLNRVWNRSFNTWQTIGIVSLMILFMMLTVYIIDQIKKRNYWKLKKSI